MQSDRPESTVKPRPVTPALLEEFMQWTRTAPMFLSSPAGSGFAEELRAVFSLAQGMLDEGLQDFANRMERDFELHQEGAARAKC